MNNNQKIITGLKKQDEKTIYKIYNEYKPGFVLFVKKYNLNDEDILDAYQEAMVALCENAGKGKLDDLKSNIKTYLFAIGKYMIFAKLRQQKMQFTSFEEVENLHFEWQANEELNNNGYTQQLQSAFEKLGGQCQNILRLFYYEEKKLEEIVSIMQYVNKDVAKSQKSRCIKKLKALVGN